MKLFKMSDGDNATARTGIGDSVCSRPEHRHGESRARRSSPARARSSTSRSRSASSSSSSDEEPPPKRRRRDSRSRSRDSIRDMDRRFELLSQQLVSHVNDMFCASYSAMHPSASTSTRAVPGPSFGAWNDPFLCIPTSVNDIADLDVSVKQPTVPKANPDRVAKLSSMQRFDSSDWNSVRYAEVQKKYVAFPAFSELKVNEELRRLEDPFAPVKWFQMERSFAALSNAFLEQNEVVNLALRNMIEWCTHPDTKLTPSSIHDKLKVLFGNESGYNEVSRDILQIICGKRAEVLEFRRRTILKCLKGKYMREDIETIPPSAEYMFNPQMLADYIQKIGGIDKLVKDSAPRVKSSVRSKSPVRPKSPIPSTSRESSFRYFQQNKPKQQNPEKRNFDQRDKKKGGRKNSSNRYRHK